MGNDRRISAHEARKKFSNLLGHVAFGGETAIITKSGKDYVAVISIDQLRKFEAMEEYLDGLRATKALEEMQEKGGKTFEEILQKYGLARDEL